VWYVENSVFEKCTLFFIFICIINVYKTMLACLNIRAKHPYVLFPIFPCVPQSHDELIQAHPMITMTDYKIEAGKVEPRLCSEHPELPYTMACKSCHSVFCNTCIESSTSSCAHGLFVSHYSSILLVYFFCLN